MNQQGHPTRDEDFDLYALGALEGEEKREIEAHLSSCGECAGKMAEARGRVALLALAADRVEPSAHAKEALMRRVRESAAAESRVAAPTMASGERNARVVRELENKGGFFSRWWAAVLVPVGVALALVSIALWMENRRLDDQLAALRTDMQQQQQRLQAAREVADLVTARDTMVVPLAQQPGTPKGAAHVMYNQKMRMLMYEGELAPAPPNKSYQLWVVPSQGNPISAGVFTPGADRTNHFMMKLPEGVTPKAFAVTLEPAGGRPQPTGPKVLVGAVT
jgi:anti-sigma-K factor RskA